MARVKEVSMKMMAAPVVNLVRMLAPARGPKAVWLPSPPPKGSSEIGAGAALQQNDRDQEEAHNNVDDGDQNENHAIPSRRVRTPDLSELLKF